MELTFEEPVSTEHSVTSGIGLILKYEETLFKIQSTAKRFLSVVGVYGVFHRPSRAGVRENLTGYVEYLRQYSAGPRFVGLCVESEELSRVW